MLFLRIIFDADHEGLGKRNPPHSRFRRRELRCPINPFRQDAQPRI